MTGTSLAKTAVHAGGAVAAIVPRSLDEAYRLATALASSGLAPKGFERPEQIMVAVMAGAELGLAPYQSMQSFAVINGRATMWGDSLVAVVRAHGCRIKEGFENEAPSYPDAMTAFCEVTRPDGEVIRATFSVADAKLAKLWGKTGRNGEPTPWVTYPKRMLKNRARAFALRDGCADMLRGVQVREEVEDFVTDVSPPRVHQAITGTGMRERLEARSGVGGFDPEHVSDQLDEVLQGDEIPTAFDAQAGEVVDPPADDGLPVRDDTPDPDFDAARAPPEEGEALNSGGEAAELELAGADFDPMDWAASFTRGLEQLNTVAEVEDAWKAAKRNGFVVKLQAKHKGAAQALVEAVNTRTAAIKGEG